MEKKFTQGEWRVCLSETSYADVVVDGSDDICTCWSGYVGEDETKANAKLIAAAPGLIEACIKLKEWNDKYPPGRIYDYSQGKAIENELTSIVKMQFEAIKKATE